MDAPDESVAVGVAEGVLDADVVDELLSLPLDVGEGVAAAVPVPLEV